MRPLMRENIPRNMQHSKRRGDTSSAHARSTMGQEAAGNHSLKGQLERSADAAERDAQADWLPAQRLSYDDIACA